MTAPEAASASQLFADLVQGSLSDFRREMRLFHKDGNTVWTSATFAGVQFFVDNMIENGAMGYITKDEAPDLLIDAVRTIVTEDRQWISPQAGG